MLNGVSVRIFLERVRRPPWKFSVRGKISIYLFIRSFIRPFINDSTEICWALTAFSVSYFYTESVGCHSSKHVLQKTAFPPFRDIFAQVQKVASPAYAFCLLS
jgi:hypothetical protein